MQLLYDDYLDKILGGWIGKSIGGAIGARFEGDKNWIEIDPETMFPEELPPNDDLDLQVLWLKVLEEKGAALTSDDLGQAWLDWCWYHFNEYGVFRRNWRLGIHPPYSGRYDNEFWETGMGCPIRSEIWGYVFPGAPDLAAEFAEKDGTLDHSEQSVAAEKMFAAMASMAFFIPDVRRLMDMFFHYLPEGTVIQKLSRVALESYDKGLSLRQARERIMAIGGHPEACDCQTNVPFTLLGLLYGENDMQDTLLSALKCGYDTDCTLATSAAFVGQILGARNIPVNLKDPIGDQLVMGIQYRREEMTLSALARDTARMGVLLSSECKTGVTIASPPELVPLPSTAEKPETWIKVDYDGLPCAAPGHAVKVDVHIKGKMSPEGELKLDAPDGWSAFFVKSEVERTASFILQPDTSILQLPMQNVFKATYRLGDGGEEITYEFGVAGAALWKFLGVYFDPMPPEGSPRGSGFHQHYVSLDRDYIQKPFQDVDELFRRWTELLEEPAVIVSKQRRIDPTQLIGLRGPYCIYLARTIISPDERDVHLFIGNNDGYRIHLNGEKVAERDERTWWSPFNAVYRVHLREGENQMLLKLIKRDERFDFSFSIAEDRNQWGGMDWCVELADRNPFVDI
ncbi:MAG: ADP-ribosylglycohydrolase family protein [Candidatus Hodarchaeota archaeon]